MIGEDTGGWTSPYRDPGDHYAYPEARQKPLGEAELAEAYRNAAQDDLEPLGPPTGVPVAIHEELRQLRAQVDALARHLELVLALVADVAGVELALDIDVRELRDDDIPDSYPDGRAGWQ